MGHARFSVRINQIKSNLTSYNTRYKAAGLKTRSPVKGQVRVWSGSNPRPSPILSLF